MVSYAVCIGPSEYKAPGVMDVGKSIEWEITQFSPIRGTGRQRNQDGRYSFEAIPSISIDPLSVDLRSFPRGILTLGIRLHLSE